MNAIKPVDSNGIFKSVNFVEVGFPTTITTNGDTNTYDVLSDTKEEASPEVVSTEAEEKKESDDSDDESIDIDEIFKDHINIAFVSALSIVGLFILFRMIQKSR